ncbi:glycosyltransferase family 2 protein [Vibrio cyclitrophicus]
MKLLSVIVPIYNSDKFLKRCIESIVDQSIGLINIELILVDDASKDESAKIIKEYIELYPQSIKGIFLPSNLKQGGARNAGLEVATGKYISFIDSDDWIDAEMLLSLFKLAENNEYDIVDCDINIHDGTKVVRQQISGSARCCHLDKDALIFQFGSVCTKLYKRKFFDRNEYGFRFPENMFFEDNYLMPFIALNTSSYGKLNKFYYNYFIDPNSTTRKRNNPGFYNRMVSAVMMYNGLVAKDEYISFKNEIDYRFIQLYGVNTLVQSLSLFDKVDSIKQKEIKAMWYSKSKFYGNRYFKKERKITKFIFYGMLHAPRLTKKIFNIKQLISGYFEKSCSR